LKKEFNIRVLSSFVLLFGLTVCRTFAQDREGKPKPKAEMRTVTGCLTKGESADEFRLTSEDGSAWKVHSSTVKLEEHVGHSVSAHGVVSNPKAHNLKEDAKSAAADTGAKKTDTEHGELKVTSLKMVSDSCK
jgi:hypothetical protein